MDVRGEALGVRVRGRGCGLNELGSGWGGSAVLVVLGMNGSEGEVSFLMTGEDDWGVLEVASMTLELLRKGLNLDSRRTDKGLLAGEGGDGASGEVLFGTAGEGSDFRLSEGSITIGDVEVRSAGGRRVESSWSETGWSETSSVSRRQINTTNDAHAAGLALGIYKSLGRAEFVGGTVPRRDDAGGCWGFFFRQNDIIVGTPTKLEGKSAADSKELQVTPGVGSDSNERKCVV